MEPQFQTSFIPKKPIDSRASAIGVGGGPISLLSIFTWVLVTLTIIVSVALFVYQQILNSQMSQIESSIASAKEAFQPTTVKQLVDTSNQISLTEKLLNSHVLVSRVFDLLQNLTLKKISYTNFSYSIDQSGNYSITMSGQSQSYNALVQQYNIFEQSGLIQNPAFSDFSLTQDGYISFDFSANIDPSVISYQKSIQPTQ